MTAFLNILLTYPIIPLFLLANLAIGFWAYMQRKADSFEDYALAGRSLPTGVLVMTLLGTFVASGDFSQPDFVFTFGAIKVLEMGCFLIAFLFIGTFVAPLLVYFHDSFTLGDLMRSFYGVRAQVVSAFLACLGGLLIVSAQMSAIGMISAKLLRMDESLAIVGFSTLIILYTFWGGMRAISYTDILQIIIAFFLFSWLTNHILQRIGGVSSLYKGLLTNHEDKLAIWGHNNLAHRTKSAIFWGLSCSDLLTLPILQRMLITQNKREVRSMWYFSAGLYALICSLLLLIGLGCVVGRETFGLKEGSQDIILHLIGYFSQNNAWVISVMYLGLLGILLSTIDSYLHAIGISVVHDILQPLGLVSSDHAKTRKVSYARYSVALMGFFAIGISLTQGASMANLPIGRYATLIYVMIIIPLVLGIMGIKTDRWSFIGFLVAYVGGYVASSALGWYIYDAYLIAVCLGLLAYLLIHVLVNGGIVTLKRSEHTVAEQLWIPSWQGMMDYVVSWLLAPFQLPTLAARKIVNTPAQPLAFSMLVFALYTFSSVMTGGGGDVGMANWMAGIHGVGITLCCGLMLEGIWPDRLKRYFPLYWFVTLLYCLPLGGTLTFFRTYGDAMAVAGWLGNLILLAVLVDSGTFMVLGGVGVGLAMGVWHVTVGTASSLVEGLGFSGVYLIGILVIALLVLGRSRERYMRTRLTWNRTASGMLGHDLRPSIQMLGGVGELLAKMFGEGKELKNAQGEQGLWVPKQHADFLEGYAQEMMRKAQESHEDINDFTRFIKQQILGWFEQEKQSMHALAKKAVAKAEDTLGASLKMTVVCKKDFEAQVLDIFPQVVSNLLNNAAVHGKASEVWVEVDGAKRTLSVRDNGQGIAADALPRIFELNYSTAKGEAQGRGIGLAFVKMVMEACAGKVSCHARHGDKDSFTEFVMTFPVAKKKR